MDRKEMNRNSISKRCKFGRRRSRSLGGNTSTELCKNIDKSLPPEERLKLLIESSVKHSFRMAAREFDISIDPESISNCLTNINSDVTAKDLYKKALSGEEHMDEKVLITNLAVYNEKASKLDKEIEKWDELLVKERAALGAESGKIQTYEFKEHLDCIEYEKLDYRKHAHDISHIVESHNYQLDNLSSTSLKINKYVELTIKVSARVNKEVEDYFSKRIEHTPMTLIKEFKRLRRKKL